nr:vasodilator-stimulated phosphoprotein-like [Aegilops tauschii subsp. strangulata]
MVHRAAAAPAPPPGSPPPPPPPPAAWLAPSTPTPAAEAAGPPGYYPVPMRAVVNKEEALAFVSAPTGASGVVRLGAGMEGADATATPQQETAAGSSSRAARRFGRLFGRAVAAIDRRPSRRPGSWAPTSLGLASAAPGTARPDHVVVDSSSDEEGSSVLRR